MKTIYCRYDILLSHPLAHFAHRQAIGRMLDSSGCPVIASSEAVPDLIREAIPMTVRYITWGLLRCARNDSKPESFVRSPDCTVLTAMLH